VFALALLLSCLTHASDLQLSVTPLIIGLPASQHYPLLVKVQNIGPSTRGEVVVEGADITTTYPIELPTGSSKAFIAYVCNQDTYEPLNVTLDTNAGRVRDLVSTPTVQPQREIITVGSNLGGLTYLRGETFGKAPDQYGYGMNSSTVADLYAAPDRLPDRSIGYDGVWAVMLGQGAEQMGDASVNALRNYVLAGGTLVFLGGASPQVLKDRRWADLVPVINVHTETKSNLAFTLHNSSKAPVSDPATINAPITLTVGDLAPGAETITQAHGTPLIINKAFGAGTAVFFAADPFEEPFTKADFRKKVMAQVLRLDQLASRSDYVQSLAVPSSDYDTSYTTYPTSFGRPVAVSNNPFTVSLPPSTTVFGILFAYALLVAPINLFILRKMKKG